MSLRKAAIKGGSWTMLGAVITAIIQILRPAILTRFLEKSDFGLMAILMVVLGFTNIFSDLGVSVALFSEKKISKREYSSLYWMSLILALILYLLLFLITPLIASFYHLSELNTLIPLIGIELIISIAGRQFQIFKQKELNFRQLAIIDIIYALVSIASAVILAYLNYGVLSLVYSSLLGAALRTFLLISLGWKSHPLSFCLDLKANKRFYKVGIFQTGSQVLDYIATQIDVIIIGKFFSVSELGGYNLIKQLIIRPYGILNSVITKVSIPVLASINDQLDRLKEKYLEMLKMVSFLNVILYSLIAIFAQEIIIILYGENYLDNKIFLQILCFWGIAASINNAASSLIVILGKTRRGFIWTAIRCLTNPIAIIAGATFSLLAMVWANSIYGLVTLIIYFYVIVKPILKIISFKDYTNTFINFILLALIMVGGLIYIKDVLLSTGNIMIHLIIFSLLYLTLYLGIHFKFTRNLLSFIKGK